MPSRFLTRARAYAVHLLTASGVVAAFLAVTELLDEAPDERVVFAWLVVAVVIDAVDGSLARAWDVKRLAPDIHGRTIDDIVDYLSFTFVPLLLVWRLGWVPFAPGIPGVAFLGVGATGQWLNGVVLLGLAALTVSPVRFLYPNLTPRPWKLPVMLGAVAWLAVLLGMLLVYRGVPGWVVGVSLIYPAFYATLSILIDPQRS
jgi:phosphatidylcholine synthase